MTIERAKQLAKKWANGYVCSLREGEAEEYHKLCFSALCAQQEKPFGGWISVEDRLPENEQDVIICSKRRYYSDPNRFIRIVAKAFHTDGKHNTDQSAYTWESDYLDMRYDEENDAYLIPEGWWESVEYGEEFKAVSDFVTHWMPLPEPPKEV